MTKDLASETCLRAVSLLAAAAILGWLGSAPARAQNQQPAQGQSAQSGASSSSSASDENDSGSDDDMMNSMDHDHMDRMMEHMGDMRRMGMMRGNGRGMPGPMMGMMAGGMGGKGAVFVIRSGQNRIVVRCAENEPMRACVDAAAVLMDKARSGSGAAQP